MTWLRIGILFGILFGIALVAGVAFGYLHAQTMTRRAAQNGRDVARCTAEEGAWSWERAENGTVTGTCIPRLLLPGRFGR